MMTSTSEVPRDPPVSVLRDDDQAKAGLNITLPMECDTDPGTSPSQLVNLHLDSSSSVDDIRSAYRYLVIILTYGLDKLHEAGIRTRKIRGLWKTRLEGWPENEPFLDPNNKHGEMGRPQKEALLRMYKIAKWLFTKKYGQASDGVSPTLESFQSQPPEAGHWDSALPKTAAGGSVVTNLRQGKQPEESSMSTPCRPTCSELGIKRLGPGLPADCGANDRQDSNAEVNENQGGLTIGLKEGPVPGPGPQLQGAESEVTEDQVLEELERYDDRESTPANFISHVVRYFTTELKPVVGVGARMPNHFTGQAGHAPVQYQCGDTSNQCEHPTVSTELRTDIRPNGTLTDSASNADECPQQENGPKTPGKQMELIFCEEPPDHHIQSKLRKRKLTSVVEGEPGPPLPKRLCPGTNGKFKEGLHLLPRPRATQTGPPTTASEMICSLCENVCSKCHCAYKL